jgi:IMP dehydrogenase/GMP reductase
MIDVIDRSIAIYLSKNGYFYIYHRFNKDTVAFVKLANEKELPVISISTGVNEDSLVDLLYIAKNRLRVDFITIDVAQGHHKKVKERIQVIKSILPKTKIIAGNVMTFEAVRDLAKWGADVVKIGIGQGCFSGDTKILMENGSYKNIKDIQIGEFVINKNGIPVKVINKINNGFQPVLKIKTTGWHDFTYVTNNHQFWMGDLSTTKIIKNSIQTGVSKQLDKLTKKEQSKFKWKRVGDVNTSNYFTLLPKKILFNNNDDSIDLSKFLSRGIIEDELIYTFGKTNGNKTTFKRFLYPSYDLGYIFGLFLGDGNSLLKRNKMNCEFGRVSWAFGINEMDIVNKLSQSLDKVIGIKPIVKISKNKNMINVFIYNKALTKLMYLFNKRENKLLPIEFYFQNSNYWDGIYDGLIDSDGVYIKNSSTVSLCNTSQKIIELFQSICLRKNILFTSYKPEIRPSKLVPISKQHYIVKTLTTNRFTKDYRFSKIMSIKRNQKSVETWDIEVDCPTHSFIANNCIVHNSICTTRFQTGFSMPMFSCIHECLTQQNINATCSADMIHYNSIPIIADGGVQNIGDVAKALVAGATMVMTGKLFASCIDSPAKIIDGKKQYRGSTSFAAKKNNKHIEGKMVDLETDITFAERLQEIQESIQSAISYGGGIDLHCFKNVKWIEGK